MQRVRQASEEALRNGLLTFEESALLIRRFDEGLSGYTYLEEEPGPAIGNSGPGRTEPTASAKTESAATPRTPEPNGDPRSGARARPPSLAKHPLTGS